MYTTSYQLQFPYPNNLAFKSISFYSSYEDAVRIRLHKSREIQPAFSHQMGQWHSMMLLSGGNYKFFILFISFLT